MHEAVRLRRWMPWERPWLCSAGLLWLVAVVAIAPMECRLEPAGGAGNMAGVVSVVVAHPQNYVMQGNV